MNITMMCKINLSKKLRALIGNKGTIVLTTDDLVDGKGEGKISIYTDGKENQSLNVSEIGETSIMLIPVSLGDESPVSSDVPMSTLFNSVPPKNQKDKVVSKLAVTSPPERGEEAYAIKSKEEINASVNIEGLSKKDKVAFKRWVNSVDELAAKDKVAFKRWVNSVDELAAALSEAKNKKSEIDFSGVDHPLQKAVLMEQKEREESIDIPAWVVNEKAGSLTINDLGVDMPLNYPLDLTRISAKRILASKDFWGLLKSGFIRIISEEERDSFMGELGHSEERSESQTFSSHREALNSISRESDEDDASDYSKETIDINERNASDRTEDEQMMINLTQRAPTTRGVPTSAKQFSNVQSPKKQSHQRQSQATPIKKTVVKTISRLD